MPLHDWTRVDAGIFHDFQLAWIADTVRTLNRGLLPGEYYALAELVAESGNSDVPILQEASRPGESAGGGTALLTAPPRTRDEGYVEVPLEETYQAAYAGVPSKYRRLLA